MIKISAVRYLIILLFLCSSSYIPWAVADEPYRMRPPLLLAERDCVSLSEAIKQVKRRRGGRVISAKTRVKDDREVHFIKVLSEDGKVSVKRIPGCKRTSN